MERQRYLQYNRQMTLSNDALNDDRNLNKSLPLAYPFVMKQTWNTTYDEATAFSRGTIFPELDMPFKGSEGCKR